MKFLLLEKEEPSNLQTHVENFHRNSFWGEILDIYAASQFLLKISPTDFSTKGSCLPCSSYTMVFMDSYFVQNLPILTRELI